MHSPEQSQSDRENHTRDSPAATSRQRLDRVESIDKYVTYANRFGENNYRGAALRRPPYGEDIHCSSMDYIILSLRRDIGTDRPVENDDKI